MLSDVQYALKQLWGLLASRHARVGIIDDYAQRAIDALERVEETLLNEHRKEEEG